MGKEIELKIPLSQVQYDDLYKKIFVEKNCTGVKVLDSSSEQIYKHDEYFTKYATLEERAEKNEPQVIRLRTESVRGDNNDPVKEIQKYDTDYISHQEIRDVLKTKKQWGESEIIDRQKRIVDFIIKNWKL